MENTMTDTILTTPAPAYVQINDQNRGYGWHGITDKDRMHLDSDALNDALRTLTGVVNSTAAANELATEKTAAAIQLANALGFTNTQNLLVSGFKDGRYDACENTGKITMQAAQNHALALAQAAECCCEIKELIREDGEKTRGLINSLETTRLATELVDAKNQITLLQLKAKP
jgi:hypothetical protein